MTLKKITLFKSYIAILISCLDKQKMNHAYIMHRSRICAYISAFSLHLEVLCSM